MLVNIHQFGCFYKKRRVSALRNITDLCKHTRELCLSSLPQTSFSRSDVGCPGTDSCHIKYMWHSLTHFSRKLWIWSFGCSLLTPGKASHKYFLFSFKPSNAWFSPSVLNHCIYFQLERRNISCWNQEKWMLNGVWWDLGRVCSIFLLILTLLKKYFQFRAYV